MKKIVFLFASMFILVSCKEDGKSIDYYKEHKDERLKKILDCKNDLNPDVDCKNANQAQAFINLNSKNIPHL
ncbi:EexN family lipoprotein [Dickeya dadantii]|uniref:EexN family lipoprotein n=1 Tax=Dickeya dadantii TaxID=204038 RepID=UPI001495F80B|nr:EexN family lipoprotein [Dickeya dadantii]NPE55913.1 EexN family lipoprotein [Dickeya dadantii]NPE67137.1 EexN family lipoprotein [Dickeya dadantii]